MASRHVIVASGELGQPVVMRPGDGTMEAGGRSGLFNRLNWERLQPARGEGLLDSNASPVLFWSPGPTSAEWIAESELGSQADSPEAVSLEYSRWVNRATGWIRRRGTQVWGLKAIEVRPDLDIRLSHITTVFALTGALAAFGAGAYATGI